MKILTEAEKRFEQFAHYAVKIFSSAITFIGAILLVAYWLYDRDWNEQTLRDGLRDIILAITFLSFFIIQKTFSHFSAVLNLKLNELIASHENARNHLVKAEDKTEEELGELAEEHQKLVEKTGELEKRASKKMKNGEE